MRIIVALILVIGCTSAFPQPEDIDVADVADRRSLTLVKKKIHVKNGKKLSWFPWWSKKEHIPEYTALGPLPIYKVHKYKGLNIQPVTLVAAPAPVHIIHKPKPDEIVWTSPAHPEELKWPEPPKYPPEESKWPIKVPDEPKWPPIAQEPPKYPPAIPQLPAWPPVLPEAPAWPPVLPEVPARPPVVPEVPAWPPVVPEAPAWPPVVPEAPAWPPVQSEVPQWAPTQWDQTLPEEEIAGDSHKHFFGKDKKLWKKLKGLPASTVTTLTSYFKSPELKTTYWPPTTTFPHELLPEPELPAVHLPIPSGHHQSTGSYVKIEYPTYQTIPNLEYGPPTLRDSYQNPIPHDSYATAASEGVLESTVPDSTNATKAVLIYSESAPELEEEETKQEKVTVPPAKKPKVSSQNKPITISSKPKKKSATN